MSAWLVGAELRWRWREFRWREIKIKNQKWRVPDPPYVLPEYPLSPRHKQGCICSLQEPGVVVIVMLNRSQTGVSTCCIYLFASDLTSQQRQHRALVGCKCSLVCVWVTMDTLGTHMEGLGPSIFDFLS